MSLEILQRFCAQPDYGRATLETPFPYQWNGRAWGVGTNGRRLLMLAGVAGIREEPGPDLEKMLRPFLAPDSSVTIDLAALADFVGVPPSPVTRCTACTDGRVPCEECGGEGTVACSCLSCGDEHDADCRACDGEGTIRCAACGGWRSSPPLRPVWIGDAPFDGALVAASLADAERTTGVARWIAGAWDAELPSAITGDDWILVIAPLRRESVAGKMVPRFELALAPTGAAV